MNALPRISIVTPSFNQARFLEETIKSVITQEYPNLEYIVIDGGSTDGSVDLIRQYESHISYWVSEKDSGPAEALNKGFLRSTGSILGYLNSDDTHQPGALAAVASAFQSDASADVVYGNAYWMDQTGAVLAERRQTPFSRLGYLYGGADLQQPATFWRREIFQKAGGIDPGYRAAFDVDLFFRFVSLGARFKFIRAVLASFRLHPDQISDTLVAVARGEISALREKHLAYPVKSLRGRVLRNVGRTQRMLWYVLQGDTYWLLGRIPDRLKSRLTSEATGPRSRWT